MFDTIIIGGGPAGLTAALYASRRSLKTLVITRDIGGQAAKTFDIENYPGIPHTTGPAFATTLKNQAENFGAKITFEDTKKIRQLAGKKSDHFEVETINNKYESKTIILALGKKPRDLEAKGEEEFKGKGVSYCATCDAPFFRNKTVAVIGGGNSALDAAVLCSGISKKVYLIYRGNSFSAEAVLVQKVQSAKNIE
jgi:thioredoxin reductase